MVVVVVPPRLERLLQVFHVQEPMQRETLTPERAVKGLDERVVHGLAGPAEFEPDMMPVRPVIQELRSKLGTIVDGDAPREAAVSPRGGQDARHVPTREGRGGSDG